LHQNWDRNCSASIGRYMQANSIGLAGGINRYVYANGNSLVIIDPGRRHSIVIPVPGVIGIGGDSTVFMGGVLLLLEL